MKLIHLSDLHIGKRLKEVSLIDDQKHILSEILRIADSEKPDGVIIAGDVYDKSVPSAEAVEVFDDFLYSLSKRKLKTFIISGNHDSPERIAFGSRIMCGGGIHLSPVYNGGLTKITLADEYGEADIFMLPFIRPSDVRRFFPEEEISSYTDAVNTAVKNTEIDPEKRNIIITHQFVTGAARCDSEDKSVGGTDNVDGSVFDVFDYTALGHIHGPQRVGTEKIRYCGSPLKYSFSEAEHKKSITVIELLEKGNTKIRTIPLVPKRDMRKIKGTLKEITEKNEKSEDYIRITLTDEEEIPDVLNRLRVFYPNILELEYDNRRTRSSSAFLSAEESVKKDPLSVFSEFYEKQNNQPMSKEQEVFMERLIKNLTEVNL